MHTQYFLAAVGFSYITSVASQSLPSLYDALVAAGASNFATFLQENTNASDLYGTGSGMTVFAPYDCAIGTSRLLRRDTTATALAHYQLVDSTTTLQEASAGANGGTVLSTVLKTSGLTDSTQKLVSDTRSTNTTTVSKRYTLNARAPSRRSTNDTSLLRIESGLGAVTNVIKADIPYDGGLIQLTDRYELLKNQTRHKY